MSKPTACVLALAISLWSLPGLAEEAASAEGEKTAAPAPAATPSTATPAKPEPEPIPPSPRTPFRRSVIGRPAPVHAPASLAGSPLPVFVDDVRTLADLVREDKELAPAADHLAARRNFLRYFAPPAAIVSAGLLLMGSLMRADAGEWSKTSTGLAVGGGSLFLLSAVVVGAVYPTRSETYDVINAWNHNHPDRPIFP